MTTAASALAAPKSPGDLIASPWHTAVVILAGAMNAYRGAITAAQSRAGLGPSRSQMYLRTMLFEILLLAIVAAGVLLRGKSLRTIFGHRWQSAGEMLRDLGIGIALWFVALFIVSILGGVFGRHVAADPAITFLLPQSSTEIALWIPLSLVAGICEEAVFRGYLQRQFSAISRSVPVGIVIAAAAFGAVHLYQGWSRTLLIAISGVLFGVVALWRGTVRPGMFAHGLQDAIVPLLIELVRH
jgi:hypothetical protein